MAYDEEFAQRVREAVAAEYSGVVDESRMFGGLAFLINGHMTVAAGDGLLVRVPPDETDALAAHPHVIREVMPGRTMRGWLRVTAPGVATLDDVRQWVRRSVAFTSALEPKSRSKKKR